MAKLKEFLDARQVKYVVITHSASFTAQEIAASAHIPGKELAKTVVVKIDGKLALAVLSASRKVDLAALKIAAGARESALASEKEFQGMFPECELGAMPPFGNLYGMAVWVDESLTRDAEIAFNAGSHTELIRLAYKDFERLASPKIARIAAGP